MVKKFLAVSTFFYFAAGIFILSYLIKFLVNILIYSKALYYAIAVICLYSLIYFNYFSQKEIILFNFTYQRKKIEAIINGLSYYSIMMMINIIFFSELNSTSRNASDLKGRYVIVSNSALFLLYLFSTGYQITKYHCSGENILKIYTQKKKLQAFRYLKRGNMAY